MLVGARASEGPSSDQSNDSCHAINTPICLRGNATAQISKGQEGVHRCFEVKEQVHNHVMLRHSSLYRVENLELVVPAVDDIFDAIDGERGLSDVGCHHHLASVCCLVCGGVLVSSENGRVEQY